MDTKSEHPRTALHRKNPTVADLGFTDYEIASVAMMLEQFDSGMSSQQYYHEEALARLLGARKFRKGALKRP